jgi:Ni2+-binding GTPase involved in regulation of expression and maturation of urease and hydrogenase
MFHISSVMLLNKTDLLPYVDFDLERASAHARKLNAEIHVLPVSCTNGEGLDQWYGWLRRARAAKRRLNRFRDPARAAPPGGRPFFSSRRTPAPPGNPFTARCPGGLVLLRSARGMDFCDGCVTVPPRCSFLTFLLNDFG